MKHEMARRDSCRARLESYLLAHPLVWPPMTEMHAHCADAWRSRLPAVRQRFARDQIGVVKWNEQNGAASAYMFVPFRPLGRSAEMPVTGQRHLFPPQDFSRT